MRMPEDCTLLVQPQESRRCRLPFPRLLSLLRSIRRPNLFLALRSQHSVLLESLTGGSSPCLVFDMRRPPSSGCQPRESLHPVPTENSVRINPHPCRTLIADLVDALFLLASTSESKDWLSLPRPVVECIQVQGV